KEVITKPAGFGLAQTEQRPNAHQAHTTRTFSLCLVCCRSACSHCSLPGSPKTKKRMISDHPLFCSGYSIYGFRTTLIQSSSFSSNILYACATSLKGKL